MSLFWSQWASPFYNAQVVHTLATDWGATVVRAAIGVESGGYLENPAAEMARLETIVDAAVAEGIYVIVDWHDHNAHQHTAQAQTFFGAVATKYGNVPNVILENYYKKSANGIKAGATKAPYAYVIPAGQKDQSKVKFVVDQLVMQGIEVGRIAAPLKLK
ncbi:MAG: hypothetical protein EOP08_14850, partial [Proteobacteria bacterium]